MTELKIGDSAGPCPVCGGSSVHGFVSRDFLHGIAGEFPFNICEVCAAEFQCPMPHSETLSGYYPSDYTVYVDTPRPKKHKILDRAVLSTRLCYGNVAPPALAGLLSATFARGRCLGVPSCVPQGKLLDIGCGNGKFLLQMQQLGWDCHGVDFSEHAIEAGRNAGLELLFGDLHSAAYPDNHFDAVTARHLVEHVTNPRELMQEIFRILKPGGRVYIETPNSRALLRSRFGIHWFAIEAPRHTILYNTDNLTLLASNAGFSVDEIVCSSTPKILLNSVDYKLGRSPETSKYSSWKRLLARPWVWLAQLMNRGDTLHAVFQKR